MKKKIYKNLIIGGFYFFLIKGLIWLVVFGVPIVVMRTHRARAFETSVTAFFLPQIGNIPECNSR